MAKVKSTNNFKLEQVFVLWRQKDKKGNYFLSNPTLVGFYNTKKKNPKEPDLRVFEKDADGKIGKEEKYSLWCNVSKDGKRKYLTGKVGEKRVVGFITKNPENEKVPYLSVYYSDDVKEEPKVEQPSLDMASVEVPF